METKKIQIALTAMLRDFHQFCKQHQINYSLAYGTLIGAIRHKGFIPWDDDIDVFMLPEDFIKFRELFHLEGYFLQNKETEEYYYLNFDKVRYLHSHAREKNYEKMLSNQGFFIDIFPLFYVPENKLIRTIFHLQLILYKYSNLILVCRTDKYKESLVGKISRFLYKSLGNNKISNWNKRLLKKLLEYPVSEQVIDYEMKPLQYWKSSYFQNLKLTKFEE